MSRIRVDTFGVGVGGDDWRQVLAAAQTGSEWAVTRLYREFHPALVAYLRARGYHDADDLAHDVSIQVAAALPSFEGSRDEFFKLVFTIARRRLIDARRKTARRRTDPAEEWEIARRPDVTADTATTAVENVEGQQAVQRILALLPQDQAEILLLRVVGGLSLSEVAQAVGRKPSAVSLTQHRALRRLAKRLAEEDQAHQREAALTPALEATS